MPFWESESYRLAGQAAMSSRPPAYELADAYKMAIEADHYNIRPWIGLADVEYAYWRSPEQAKRKEPLLMRPLIALDKALDRPRNPNNLGLRRAGIDLARAVLREMPATRQARGNPAADDHHRQGHACPPGSYPTNATLRAELAQASADLGMYVDAAREAKQALLLDGLTPHDDKKLPKGMRAYLEGQIPSWEARAKEPPPAPPSKGPAMPPGWPGGAGRVRQSGVLLIFFDLTGLSGGRCWVEWNSIDRRGGRPAGASR